MEPNRCAESNAFYSPVIIQTVILMLVLIYHDRWFFTAFSKRTGFYWDAGGGLFLIDRDHRPDRHTSPSVVHLIKKKTRRDHCSAVCTTSTIVPTALRFARKGSQWVAMATFQHGWPVSLPMSVIISVVSARGLGGCVLAA